MTWLLTVATFALVSVITPGPNNVMLLTSGLNFGVRRTVPHALGVICGVPLMVLSLGLGAGALFINFPSLHQLIKVLGAGYLLYLAWRVATTVTDYRHENSARPFTFLQALLFQWVNPKAWVMVLGAVSAFTTVGNQVFDEVLLIALAFLLMACISSSTWTCGGMLLSRLLTQPRHKRWFNGFMGFLLAVTVLPIIRSVLVS